MGFDETKVSMQSLSRCKNKSKKNYISNLNKVSCQIIRKIESKFYANKIPFDLHFMLRGFNLNFMQRTSKLLFDIRELIQILTT